MAVTQNTYTGNGSATNYSFTFPYLETTDIKVSINGTLTTAYTLANPTTIQFTTAPANGAAIRIYRVTDDSALAATFYSGAAIRATDLNENFTQNLYVTQESSNNASTAITTANSATTTANTALSTANTASTNASAAVATANTASTNASNAVTTANTASTNASNAVTTANAASTTANTASTNAATALSTANTASTNASNAVTTANTASTNASTALSTANTAASNAATALSQSNTALSQSASAVTTANTANTNATAALNAVAAAVQYVLVANVAAIPASPANGYAVEVIDSTGIESFSPVTNRPAGFVGDSGLSVRLQYSTTGPTWNWLGYYANNSENRYLKLSGGTLTGQLRADDSNSTGSPVYAFDGDTNTGIAHTGADELALVTGGTARITIDGSGNVSVPGALTKGGNNVVTTGDTGTVTSTMLADNTIVNADVNASAAIAGTKISPDFGSQTVQTTGVVSHALGTAGAPTVTFTGDTNTGIYSPGADQVAISTNGTGRLFVDSSGRLGLGTSTVNSTLHICDSSSAANGTIRLGGGSAFSGYYSTIHQDASTTGKLLINTAAAAGSVHGIQLQIDGTSALAIDSSRRVGIGASTVNFGAIDHGVHIYGAGAQEGIRLETTNGSSGILEIYAESGGNTLDTRGSGYLRFSNAATEWGRWDSSGRFLVGTSSSIEANAPLQVYKSSGTTVALVKSGSLANGELSYLSVQAGSAGQSFGLYKHSGITNAAGFLSLFAEDGATNYLWTDNSDILRISTDPANVGTTGGTVIGAQTSDERIKNILGPVEYGLDTLKQIEPVRYSLQSEPETEKLGFIAQQVQPLVPQSVFDTGEHIEGEPEDAPTKLGMEYVALIPVLVNAIKELSAEVDALKAQLS